MPSDIRRRRIAYRREHRYATRVNRKLQPSIYGTAASIPPHTSKLPPLPPAISDRTYLNVVTRFDALQALQRERPHDRNTGAHEGHQQWRRAVTVLQLEIRAADVEESHHGHAVVVPDAELQHRDRRVHALFWTSPVNPVRFVY